MIQYEEISKLIKKGKFDKAQELLDGISERDAEWHYRQAQLYLKRRWYGDGKKELEIAVQLAPENKKYQSALAKLNKRAKAGKIKLNTDVDDVVYSVCEGCCTSLCDGF